jgi:hypothetical protein
MVALTCIILILLFCLHTRVKEFLKTHGKLKKRGLKEVERMSAALSKVSSWTGVPVAVIFPWLFHGARGFSSY